MKLALGTVQFGLDYGVSNTQGQLCIEEIKKIINCAQKNNINTLDTAAAYGNSEKIIGNLCSKAKPPLNIVTKLSPCINNSNLTKQLESSLVKLKVDSVYAVMLHDVEILLSSQGDFIYQQLIELKQKHYCKKIGVSVYTPAQLTQILERYDIDIVQLPINIFDQRFSEPELIKSLKNRSIEIHARSLFLQGLLLMERNQMPIYFKQFNKVFEKLEHYCNSHSFTKLEACIAFSKSLSFVDKIVIGVNKLIELEEIINLYNKTDSIDFSPYAHHKQHLINPAYWP